MSKAWDADAYQKAEERLCECGAAGSGEDHTIWCPWLGSEWHRAADERDGSEAEGVARPNQKESQ